MNNQLSLVILAVDLDSRDKVPAKLQVVGPHKEMLIEYTIYNALKTGIKHFVFVMDQDFKDEHRKFIKNLIDRKNGAVEFILQTTFTAVSRNYFDLILSRQSNWGTAHALLVAKKHLVQPFIVINYEEYYGRESFRKASRLHSSAHISPYRFGTILYQLQNTIHKDEVVERYFCKTKREILKSMHLLENITRYEDKIVFNEEQISGIVENETPTCVGFWVFHPSIFKILEDKFDSFMKYKAKDGKSKFELIDLMREIVMDKNVEIEVDFSDDKWIKLSNLDDRDLLNQFLKKNIENSNYPLKLWE